MLKKLLSAFLVLMVLTAASSANVFARARSGDDEKTGAAKREKQTEKKDWSSIVKIKSDSAATNFEKRETRGEHERLKREGKKFSTTTKVLIGVGVAAVVIIVVAVLANKGFKDAATF